MTHHSVFLYELDKSIDLEIILSKLNMCFAFVYLQDQICPIIGIYPKLLWHVQKRLISLHRTSSFSYRADQHPLSLNFKHLDHTTKLSEPLGFNGGYISFISYDFAKDQQLTTQSISKSPQLLIGEYDIFLKKINGIWYLHVPHDLKDHLKVKELIDLLQPHHITQNTLACVFESLFQPRWSYHQYKMAFDQVQAYLYAGDCYQINLTQEFSAKLKQGKIATLLPVLMRLTQAPYAGYMSFDDFELLSCSPELFIEFDQNRLLKTRPIKGTLPRGSNPIEDQQLKHKLADSEKDQAENLMIVDLLRNDLSVYAETGSVKVPKLFEIESFAQVHHMVSEIHATLKAEVNPFEVLLSALPGGSITGAPKIRAMEIIDEIEGNNRGAYCGSLGYFNYDGTGRFNILIRSIQRYGDDVSVWAGGGITVRSNVDSEYQETLDKVSAILNVLNQYAEKPNT